ncbi:integrin alpha-E-like [Pseudorasbora parva]|uniref:integrin alpha-E-like n=1 Tax=Pseudorasbora parva TaxID=51549 RepID=UPI00351DCC5E
MYKGLPLLFVICSVTGFNIQISPVKHFTNDDPLFGQTVIQSKNGVFVPSPSNGELFSCTLKDECVKVNLNDEKPKGLNTVASVAAAMISEEEHVVMCNQVLKRKSGTEYLNGNCQLMTPIGKVELNPVELVVKNSSNNNNNNNNNNNKRRRSLDQVKQRKRREAQADSDTKTVDDVDEDAGTEIAFVLDGSGSIDYEDFKRAKDFMSNVMYNVWDACFNCDFAIVQYGNFTRTELSLLENEDGGRALDKVKEIQQIGSVTKTASAIHHVLTHIFVPENGSNKNSKKIIIVLSDGQILGDNMTLTDVLNMPQMKDVNRYAIGVGEGILSKKEAINEMMEIADPGQFFNVSNYAALDDILSKLEKSIIEVEGTQKGAGFQFQLAEAGFSSHIVQDKSVLFGAVGASDWSGGVILKSDGTARFMNDNKNGPKFSYLGYSVTSAHLSSKTLYISGAPRYNLTGGVFIFDDSEEYVLQGDQVGSYFGSVLCALDIDKNQYTDHLLVGAPHFHKNGEEGKVLVYRLNQHGRFESVTMELQGDAGQTFARFGAAIGSIGDIDRNKYNDVAVGAPLETDGSGSIYIYSGFEDGLKFSQKIAPSNFGMKLVHFGQSVSGASAMAPNKPCIAVGSQKGVTVFETIPVVLIKPEITIQTKIIPLEQQMKSSKISIDACFKVKKGRLQSETLPLEYQIDLDYDANKKRVTADNSDQVKNTFILTPEEECTNIKLQYLGCFDCFSPIKIKMNFSLAPNPNGPPIRIHDIFSPTEVSEEITFENNCTGVCKPSITLSDSKISETKIIIGETQSLNINFNLTNTEDPSYMTTLTLTYPSILSQRKIEGAPCPVKTDNQIQCNIQHPVFETNTQTNVFFSWQLNDIQSELRNSEIIANLTSQNQGSQFLDSKIFAFNVMYSLPIQLTGTASPNRLRIEEGGNKDTQMMQFVFQFAGKNNYGATVDVVVNITKDTHKTDLKITSVKPEECVWKENYVTEPYIIRCTMKELQKIVIDASVLIHDVQEKSDKITAVGQYSFNETVYATKDQSRTVTVEVMITKLIVTSSKGAIIGGSIGGFLFLFIIIIILIKCGFFRRRHKVDQAQVQTSPN